MADRASESLALRDFNASLSRRLSLRSAGGGAGLGPVEPAGPVAGGSGGVARRILTRRRRNVSKGALDPIDEEGQDRGLNRRDRQVGEIDRADPGPERGEGAEAGRLIGLSKYFYALLSYFFFRFCLLSWLGALPV